MSVRRTLLALLATAALRVGMARADDAIPEENRSGTATPPARPSADSAQEVGRKLFEAIARDQPALASAVFFPRDAFLRVKAMAKPERYHERLARRFEADIHALHQRLPELARGSFVELALGRRGGYVRSGEEGNRLPYWAARHALLRYRVGDQLRALEVRVLINWGPRWYVIHLNEFR